MIPPDGCVRKVRSHSEDEEVDLRTVIFLDDLSIGKGNPKYDRQSHDNCSGANNGGSRYVGLKASKS